jgi:hypothetical protein
MLLLMPNGHAFHRRGNDRAQAWERPHRETSLK